ncbi:response regulator [Leptolyngbya sp. GB1-A1]|uniref:response regulator n=1 Tax=Leptolyngbya sp. GB1-A1 TaxID=2933908 RepID=UPI0032970DC6
MAINPEIRDQAYRFFVEEAPDLLQAIESGLLTLRQERSPATIHAIMRSAHSLKGGAASVGLEAITAIAHRVETIFKALYSDRLEIDTYVESQLLQAYDCLRIPLTEQITQGHFDAEQSLAVAEPILSQLEERFQEAIAETENFIPGSADLGIDMAASIFEIDVTQGLVHLEQVLEHPQDYEVAGELRAQAEVFLGFAELLSLSGFAAIAQMVIEAINRAPDQVVVLTRLALNDFRAGQQAVLAGDSLGGNPSTALLAFVESSKTIVIQPKESNLLDLESLAYPELDIKLNTESNPKLNFELNAELAEHLSDVEIEAIIQQELLQGEPEADHLKDELQTETHTLTFKDQSELDSIFTDSVPASSDRSIDQFFAEFSDSTDEQSGFLEESIAIELDNIQSNSLEELADIQSDFNLDFNLTEQISPGSLNSLQLENFELTHEENCSPQNWEARGADSVSFTDISFTDISFIDNATDSETDALGDALQSTARPAESLAEPIVANSVANNAEVNSSAAVMVKLAAGSQSAAYPVTSSLTVRVDADRLERLNKLLGEMTINRNGLALQNNQTRMALRELRNRFERMQSTIDQIRTLSDKMLIAPDSPIGEATTYRQSVVAGEARSFFGKNGFTSNITALRDFDSLEMDRYTSLYASTQSLLEEMAQIEEAVEDIVLFNHQSEQTLEQHRKMLSQMQDDLMWARMLPLGDVLNRFPRMLRDLSNTYNKPIDLVLSGTDLLIDKAVLEKLYDPLLHLLRNSFDHGIESTKVRRDRGKPPTGRIEIQASSRGRQVVIEVRDDGQGIDFDRIRQRAIELDWMTPVEGAAATEAQLCELIFAPGFSTAAQVSELSGRGIGLDVVQEQLQLLKGSVTVRSTLFQGTTFILTLPLTLTITNLLLCLVNSRPVAIRSDGIREILIPQPHQLTQTENGRSLQWQDQQVPIYRMADLLTYRCLVPELPPSRVLAAVPAPSNWEAPVLILKHNQQPVALQIDRLITEQEFVVKPFGSAIAPPDYTYGCTVLGDGMLVPVIDGQIFLETLLAPPTPHPSLHPAPDSTLTPSTLHPIRQIRTTTILVVDDALTSRRILALSLERAGYQVLQARDGQEALEQLQQSQGIALVVCDIEMPNMNGFEFLTHRRQDTALAQIPTVMLTSRSNDKHRWLAMQLGATAYFTKPYLEQEFLQAIGRMVGVGE